MNSMSSSVSDLFGSVYEAAYDAAHWSKTLENLRLAMNGSVACLCRIGPEARTTETIRTYRDDSFADSFTREYYKEFRFYENALRRAPIGNVYNDESLIGRASLRNSRFWNEWMRPQDMYSGLGCKLYRTSDSVWFLDIQRGRNQRLFDKNDYDLLGLVIPHLQRAIRINRRLQNETIVSSLSGDLPYALIIVDSNLKILATNSAADRLLLKRQSPISAHGSCLSVGDAHAASLISRLVTAAHRRADEKPNDMMGNVLVRSPDRRSEPHLMVSVRVPSEHMKNELSSEFCAVLLIQQLTFELSPDFELSARSLFGLSPVEARVAASICMGFSLAECANYLGLSVKTARSYLEVIFRKTETTQQSQLVALLKNADAFLEAQRGKQFH